MHAGSAICSCPFFSGGLFLESFAVHGNVKRPGEFSVLLLHFTYPTVHLTVGAPRMIGQPLFSILLCFRPFEGLHPTLILSTPLCCLPISFSVCLSFSLLVQCPVGSSLQVLLILFCAHTIFSFRFFTVVRRSS